MNNSNKLYTNYISDYKYQQCGEIDIEKLKSQFKIWDKIYLKHLPERKEIRILDIGCGEGGIIYWLQNIGYKDVLGIDISDEQVELANKLGIKNVEKADIKEYLNNCKNTYDVIIAKDVIEHFKKDEILNKLELVYKVLDEKGIFIIQTTNAESPFFGRYRYGDFTHEMSFTEQSMFQVLKEAEFKEIKIYSLKPVMHGIKSIIRRILWYIIELIIRCYMLAETGAGKGIFTQNIIVVAKK